MQTRDVMYRTAAVVAAAALSLSGCSSDPDGPSTGDAAKSAPEARSIDFDVPTSPQEAEKASPPGDRTTQMLLDVATNGKRLVAVGRDESFNVIRPLVLSSDDAGGTWTRRKLTADSVALSSVDEVPTQVAAGPGGFVAVGLASTGPVVWTSPNGTDWTRRPTDRKTFQGADDISGLTVTSQGYVLVGVSAVGNGGSPNHAIVWRSRDGVAWHRTAGPSVGLKQQVPGTVDITGVAANGNVVVVSGNLNTPTNTKQPDRLQFWRSSDGGATFTKSAVTGDVASAYRTYSQTVTFQAGRFYALIQGDGPDVDRDTGWDGVVMEGGAGGASWRVVARPAALATGYDESPQALFRIGKEWVIASRLTTDTEDTTVHTGPNWTQLFERSDSSQIGSGDQVLLGATAIGSDVVMVGRSDSSGTTEAAIWRYRQGKTSAVALPPEASGGRPSALVTEVVGAGKDLVAVGEVAGAPMSWSLTSDGWRAVVLPGRESGVAPGLVDATVAPDGRVVAVGYKVLATGRDAALWTRAIDGRWSQISSPVFGRQAKSEFGGPLGQGIAVGPKRWVAVGQRHDGDGHFDAWAVYSADGKTWQDARGGRVLPVDKDSETRRTPWSIFRAPAAGAASMNNVLADKAGFVAGGFIMNGRKGVPTVWLSPDGESWPTRVSLPMPPGYFAAEVTSVRRVGGRLTATGLTAKTDGDTQAGWISWHSADNGRTWRVGTGSVLKQATVKSVLAVPGGLVALGTTGPRDSTDAAAWFSNDGAGWRSIELPGDRVKGPGIQSLVSAVVRDDKLLVVASDVPPSGGGYYTLELPVPN